MTGTPPTLDTPQAPAPGRKHRGRLFAGVAAVLVVTGLGAPAAVHAVRGDAPVPVDHRHEAAATTITLGDSSGRLEDPDLPVEIIPDSDPAPAGTVSVVTDEGPPETSDEGTTETFDEADQPIATFPVDGDRIDLTGASGKMAAEARAIWERFVELIPADQRRMVVGFELLAADAEGAYVHPTDEDPTKWKLAVSLGLGNDLDGILIHEFGHLLTLQAREVPPGDEADAAACSTYFTGEGCALSGSTFARFVERFWPQDLVDEVDTIQMLEDGEAADEFWRRHHDDFVTDYATTNPGEDLAETFAVFVMTDKPTGDTIADQKVRFLWEDPAMTALRDQIRTHLTPQSAPPS